MRLKLEQLQSVVKTAISEKKALDVLKTEATKTFGPIIDTSLGLKDLAETINDRINVLNATGRKYDCFKPEVLGVFSHHHDAAVRKMAANLLPEDRLSALAKDKSNAVRAVVANRISSLGVVREMMRSFPTDEEIKLIYRRRNKQKKLFEAAVEEFDIHGTERLGDAAKTQAVVELSENWYKTKAYDLLNDFAKHNSIDNHWEERAVIQYCEHYRVTSGVVIDHKKLLDALKELIEDREERHLKLSDNHVGLCEQYRVEPKPGGTFDVVDDMGVIVEPGFATAAEAQMAVSQYEDELNTHYDSQADYYDDEYDLPANDMKPMHESVRDDLGYELINHGMHRMLSNQELIEMQKMQDEGLVTRDLDTGEWKLTHAGVDQFDDSMYESQLMSCVKNLLSESKKHGKKQDRFLLPEFKEEQDVVRNLIEAGFSKNVFIERAQDIFGIKMSIIPAAIKKYVIGEGFKTRKVPMKARLPHSKGLRRIDEQALDHYVNAWNSSQVSTGEPYKLSWHADPGDDRSIGFSVVLR